MKKKIDKENPFKSLGVGYAYYLRNGAGAHQDKKKEQKRKECRDKLKTSDWKSYFLPWGQGERSGFKSNRTVPIPATDWNYIHISYSIELFHYLYNQKLLQY